MMSIVGRTLTASFRNRPVFVVGAGRSGTTAVQKALGAHPEIISSTGEAPFICAIGSAATSLAYGDNVDYRLGTLRTSLVYTSNSLQRIAFESAMGAGFGLRSLFRVVIKDRKLPLRLKRWCTKTFPRAAVADGLSTLYPEARFIYVFRNGCEVIQSRTRFHGMRQRDFEEHCRDWAESVDRYEYLLEDDRAQPVRHEELADDPDGTFDRLLSFLDVSPNPAPARFARTTLVHPLDEPTEIDVRVQQRLRDRAPAHETWSHRERQTFNALCGKAMDKLGYEVPF